MSTAVERLRESRLVLRDQWLEAGGCEPCSGTGTRVEEDEWPGEEALRPQGRHHPTALFSPPSEGRVHRPTEPRLRRYPCEASDHVAGIDPSLDFARIARHLRIPSTAERIGQEIHDARELDARRVRWFPLSFSYRSDRPLAATIVVQSQTTFRGIKLVVVETELDEPRPALGGATRITGWFVGSMNQWPTSYTGGISSRCFAPHVRDNELDLDTCPVAVSMTVQVEFLRPCLFEATLFGLVVQ